MYRRVKPKKKDDADQLGKQEIGNPAMGVLWLTMEKVIFTPLLVAGAGTYAGGVTLGNMPGRHGSSSQPRAMT